MQKSIFKYIIIVLIILAFGVGFVFWLCNNKDKANNEKLVHGDVNYTLNDIKRNFLKTNYSKDNKCKVKIESERVVIKCKDDSYEFKVNNDFLEMDTKIDGFDVVKNVVNVIEHLLGSDKDYSNVMDLFFTGKIFLNNIFMNKSNDLYSFVISLSNIVEYYEVNAYYEKNEKIIISDRNYEVNVDDYVFSGIDIASDEESRLYVMTGTVFNENRKYDRKIKIVYYDDSNNKLMENIVNMNDFDKSNTFLRFSVVSKFSDSIDIIKVNRFTIDIE